MASPFDIPTVSLKTCCSQTNRNDSTAALAHVPSQSSAQLFIRLRTVTPNPVMRFIK